MGKLLLVARYEYLRFVRRRSFLLAVLSLPLLLILIVAAGELAKRSGVGPAIGYVDEAGLLRVEVLESSVSEELREAVVRPFTSVESGRTALEAGEIDALFVLPADYLQDRSLQASTGENGLAAEARAAFGDFITASLAVTYESRVAERLVRAPHVTVRSVADSRELEPSSAFPHFAVPFVAGFLFIMAAMISAGYLLQAVTDEKENRTVEILTTSVSSTELIVGKTLGLVGVVGTQLSVWIAGVVAAALALIGAQFIEVLGQMEVPWLTLGVAVAFFVPAYLLLSGIMVCLGSAFPEYRQSQQLAAVVNILFLLPLFFTTLILSDPDGLLATFLSFFPTTSFLTILLRWPATTVPFWQLAVAWTLLTATATLLVWSAPRIFRAGMLRYGQRLTLQAAWQALGSRGPR